MMKGKKATPEQRSESLTLAFALMSKKMKAELVEAELIRLGLFPYAAPGLRGYYSRWRRKADFTDILIDDPDAVIQCYAASEADTSGKHRIPVSDTEEAGAGASITDEHYDTQSTTVEPAASDPIADSQRIPVSDTVELASVEPIVDKHRQSVSTSVEDTPDIDDELLRRMRAMIDHIQVADRGTTAPGRKRDEALKTQQIGARLPVKLVEELKALPGRFSHHIEKAIALYLKALRADLGRQP
jgi:hypothetical protein